MSVDLKNYSEFKEMLPSLAYRIRHAYLHIPTDQIYISISPLDMEDALNLKSTMEEFIELPLPCPAVLETLKLSQVL